MITALYEIAMSLRPFNSGLHLVALIVVLFLFSSPGIAGTVVGVGAKLGILGFVRGKRAKSDESAAESAPES